MGVPLLHKAQLAVDTTKVSLQREATSLHELRMDGAISLLR